MPQAVSKAKPIWSFLVTYCLPLDRRYSSKLPFPMNSVTRKILLFTPPPLPSSITRPRSRTRFSCCKDLRKFILTTIFINYLECTYVMTFASPRKFWVAADESFISSFTATFWPLGLLLLLFVSHFLPPNCSHYLSTIQPSNKTRKSTLGLDKRFRFVSICLGLKYLPV